MSHDVAAIGELLIDFTPINYQGITGFLPNPGGAPANVAATVSRLGGNSAFIGKVGDDQFGHFLKGVLENENVDVSGLVLDKAAPTTLAFVHLDEKGERDFSFYRNHCADTLLTIDELALSVIKRNKILHFCSVSLTTTPIRETVIHAVEYAKNNNVLVSFDPNYRPFLWSSDAQAVEAIRQVLPLADIIKVSQEEMELITGKTDLSAGSDSLREYGAKLIVVTCGSAGSYYCYNGHTAHVPAYKVKVTDTNGAGDAFWGGLLYHLTRFEDALSLSCEEMEKALRFANAVGALTTTKSGAISALPTMDEVQILLQQKIKHKA